MRDVSVIDHLDSYIIRFCLVQISSAEATGEACKSLPLLMSIGLLSSYDDNKMIFFQNSGLLVQHGYSSQLNC